MANAFTILKDKLSVESQTDTYLSTTRKYIEAMGGKLEIVAKFPEGNVKVGKFEGLEI